MKTIQVLVVDDEQLICRNIKSKLLRLSHEYTYEVHTSLSGQNALNIYSSLSPDLLITDIRMPNMNGLELVRKVREIDEDVKIFVLSGHDDFDYVRQAFLLGVDDYLLKPLSFYELSEKLQKYAWEPAEQPVELPSQEEQSFAQAAKTFINNNIHRPLAMKEVADACAISYSYFSALFKDEVGATFSQYVNMQRMELAKEMLQNPTSRVADVAYQVGFTNAQHFSRAFRRTYGLSPNQYKKSLRKDTNHGTN